MKQTMSFSYETFAASKVKYQFLILARLAVRTTICDSLAGLGVPLFEMSDKLRRCVLTTLLLRLWDYAILDVSDPFNLDATYIPDLEIPRRLHCATYPSRASRRQNVSRLKRKDSTELHQHF